MIKRPLTGLLTEEIFYNIFSKFFPLGGDTYNGESGGRRQEAGGRRQGEGGRRQGLGGKV